jgi:hypothetical protein
MKRREAIQLVTLSLGACLSSAHTSTVFAQAATSADTAVTDAALEALLAEVADVIIPTTDTPGAKAAGVEKFIVRVLRDCHKPEEQKAFYAGLAALDAEAQNKFGQPFAKLTEAQKNQSLSDFASRNKSVFQKLKQLTVTGYFTSEIGATQALAYLPIPGRFQGSVPMEQGQKTWAL